MTAETRTYRWLADRAGYMFWTMWGSGAGATVTVFVYGFLPSGDAIKTLLTILGAGLSVVSAIVGTRIVDAFVDTRKRRRIIRAAKVSLITLRGSLQVFRELRVSADARLRDAHSLVNVFALAQQISVASAAPDLSEVLETTADMGTAERVRGTCLTVQSIFSAVLTVKTVNDQRSVAIYFLDDPDIDRKIALCIEVLKRADSHLDAMLQT